MFPLMSRVLLILALACSVSLPTTMARPVARYEITGLDNGCSQDPKEQSQLIREAESKHYSIRRVEFLGNTSIRHNVLAKRLFFTEGDIFTRKLLERSLKNLSRLKIIESVRLIDVEVNLVREYEGIDIQFCIKERRRSH